MGLLSLLGSSALAAGPKRPDWYLAYDWGNSAYQGRFVSPLEHRARVTSGYGWRISPLESGSDWHGAVDLEAVEGTPVFAAYPGVVVATSENRTRPLPKQLRFLSSRANPTWVDAQMVRDKRWKADNPGSFDKACGNFLIQGILPSWNPNKTYYAQGTQGDWDWGGFVVYCHLAKVIAPTWSAVRVENQIAESGATGAVTGPHLHIAIYLIPGHLPPRLRASCKPGRDGSFEGTCPVDPQHYLVPRGQ